MDGFLKSELYSGFELSESYLNNLSIDDLSFFKRANLKTKVVTTAIRIITTK